MRRLAALILAALLLFGAGCAPKRMTPQPGVLLRLSIADQTCARKDGTVPVAVFITLTGQPAGLVRVLVNEQVDTILLADPTATLELYRVGYGSHTVRVTAGGRDWEKQFSVGECASR